MATTATVLIGTGNLYADDISATHLTRLVEGDRAVWVLTELTSGEVARWFPHRPDRIGADLWGLIGAHVLDTPGVPEPLGGQRVKPTEDADVEIDTLGAIARTTTNLFVVVTALPGSSLTGDNPATLMSLPGGATVVYADATEPNRA